MEKAKLVAAAIVLGIAVWGSIMVPPDLAVPVRLWPGGPDAPVPVFLMPLLGVAAGWGAMRLWRGFTAPPPATDAESDRPPPLPDSLFAILAVPVAALAVLVLVAVDAGAIEVLQAALLLVCGSLALTAGAYALAALREGDAVELSSHWGGLGGGLGGWRLSPVATMLLLTLIFLGTAVAVGGGRDEAEAVENGVESSNQTSRTTNGSTTAPAPRPAPGGARGATGTGNQPGNTTGPG